MKSYNSLINIKYRRFSLIIIVGFLMVILFGISFFIKCYSSYNTIGVFNNLLIVSVPLENSDAVTEGNYLKINNKKYSYTIENISELKYHEYQNYQDYTLKINQNFQNNEIIQVTFYYNKQRIIKKIIKMIF